MTGFMAGAGIVVRNSIIQVDPIFKGLALSLMFGEIASLLIGRMVVPVLYFLVQRHGTAKLFLGLETMFHSSYDVSIHEGTGHSEGR